MSYYEIDYPWTFCVLLVVVLIGATHAGYWLRRHTTADTDDRVHEQIVAAAAAVGLLLSLLIAFTLSMAVDRFNVRRELMVDEANSVGTTDLRARMLPAAFSEPIRAILLKYVDVRLEYGRSGYDDAKLQRALLRTKELQDQLWRHSVALAREARDPITSIFLQSLNQTIDLSEKRLAALENRVPLPVWIMLVLIATLACTVVGATVRRRYWLAMLISPVMIAVAMGFVADLDSPRTGLIRVSQSSMDRLQQDLRKTATPR
jgi:cytochrome bd-type quinol oxidase subunit 2